MLKAVIFDMDGVITNTMPDHYLSWKVILKKEGINISHYDIYSREGQPGAQAVKELFSLYGKVYKKKEKITKIQVYYYYHIYMIII